jgi:hypothetical protein
MTIVSLPDTTIQDSRERSQATVHNVGLLCPRNRLVIKLALAAGGFGGLDQPGTGFAELPAQLPTGGGIESWSTRILRDPPEILYRLNILVNISQLIPTISSSIILHFLAFFS